MTLAALAAPVVTWALTLPFDDIPVPIPDKEVEWIERYRHIIYPSVAALVVLMLVVGVVRAWRASSIDVEAKIKYKRELIQLMRENLSGVTGESLAKAIGLDNLKTLQLLEELQKDGVVISHTTSSRLTMWRLKAFVNGVPA